MMIRIGIAALASLVLTAGVVASEAPTFRTVYFPDGRAFGNGQGKSDLDLEAETGEAGAATDRFLDSCGKLLKDITFANVAKADAALEEAASATMSGTAEALRLGVVRKVWAVLRLALDAAACRQAITATEDPAEVVRLARQAIGDVEALKKAALTPAEEKEAFRNVRKYGFARWKDQTEKSFASPALLESAVDAAFERLAKKLGPAKAKAFLEPLAKDPSLAQLAAARLYLLDNTPRNLVVNGSFEETCRPAHSPHDEADWEPLGAAGGWTWWKFPNTSARVSLDDKTARTGKRSAVIEGNTCGCTLINRWKVAPRAPYRLSFWVKEACPGGRAAGSVSVRFRNGRGQWIDGGRPVITRQIPDAAVGNWVEISLLLATPDRDDWVYLVPLFSSDDGSPDGVLLSADRLWIDDVRLEKLSNAAFAGRPQQREIRPGELWYDTDGHVINAHGGGILFDGGTYWWYGEHKIYGPAGNAAHVGVHVYSSDDLVNWDDRGVALAVAGDESKSEVCDGCVLERPKVIRCPKTGKYSMFFHLELRGQGYKAARVGIATADRPAGPFRFLRSLRPNGAMSRDMTLFVDDDGKAYHVFASEDNATLHIDALTDDCLDYTGTSWHLAVREWTEAPALVKSHGYYWLLGSGCTGWAPNKARLYRAEKLEGPWTNLGTPCRGIDPKTHFGIDITWGCQSTFFLPVAGDSDKVIALFDRWYPKNHLESRYVWLPVTFEKDRLTIEWKSRWSPSETFGIVETE